MKLTGKLLGPQSKYLNIYSLLLHKYSNIYAMTLITKNTEILKNGNIKTIVKFFGIPILTRNIEKEENTVRYKIDRINEVLDSHFTAIQRLETK